MQIVSWRFTSAAGIFISVSTHYMKRLLKYFYLLIVFFNGYNSFGQKNCDFYIDSLTNEKIFTKVDENPFFGESLQYTVDYVGRKVKFPFHYDGKESIDATVIISENGKIEKIKIVKPSYHDGLNENFIRVLEQMETWQPGKCDGIPVKTEIKIPLRTS